MKAFTDINQSKKLAEILSNKTSDMYYWCGEDIRFGGYKAQDKDYDIPCWSLAALINILPASIVDNRYFLEISKMGDVSKPNEVRYYRFRETNNLL